MLAQIGNDPTSTNAIVSVTETQAKQRLAVIKRIIESSEAWALMYPDVRVGDLWTDTAIRTSAADPRTITPTCLAVGLDSNVTIGQRISGLMVCDDIHSLANSATLIQRQKVIEIVRSTLFSRLKKEARIAFIGTPWADGDAYQFLESIGYHTIRTPALDANGASYWPEQFSLADLEEKKKRVGLGYWLAQFMLEKNLVKGSMFRREWFDIVEAHVLPPFIKKVRYWDLAATKAEPGKEPAWTVGTLMALDRLGYYYILDVRRARGTPYDVELIVKQTADADGRDVEIYMEQEPGSGGVNTIFSYRRLLAGWRFYGDPPRGSKETRAKPLSSMAQGHAVKLKQADWNIDWLDEAENFPFGIFKDQIDSASGAYDKMTVSSGGAGAVK